MRGMRRLTLTVLGLFAFLPLMAQPPALTATLTDAVTGLPSTGLFLWPVEGQFRLAKS